MIRVVLIDDEAVIRAGMRTIIDWAACGCEIVGEAGDGASGLALLLKLRPDIALVDVKMPTMHGIDMIREAKACGLTTRFVVLSGYGDFAYTKQAILLGVDAYLLKPVEEEELIETLHLLGERLDQARRDSDDRSQGHRSRLGEQLRHWLESGAAPEEAQRSPDMAALLGAPAYAAALLALEAADGCKRAQAVACLRAEGYFAYEGEAVCVVLSQATPTNLPSMVEGVQARLRARMGMDCFFAVGVIAPTMDGLHASWRAAQRALENAFLFRDRPFVLAEAMEGAPRKDIGHVETALSRLASAALIHDRDGMEEALSTLCGAFAEGLWPESEIKMLTSGLVVELLAKAQALGGGADSPEREGVLRTLFAAPSLVSLCDSLGTVLSRVAALLGDAAADTAVKRVVAYLDRHYAERLTLESLGTLFGYNGAYLGRMFKKHTGMNLPDYLEKTRVEQAKALLREGVKVFQVAQRVGFANQAYFSAKFKKREGISPKDYMQQCTNNERK